MSLPPQFKTMPPETSPGAPLTDDDWARLGEILYGSLNHEAPDGFDDDPDLMPTEPTRGRVKNTGRKRHGQADKLAAVGASSPGAYQRRKRQRQAPQEEDSDTEEEEEEAEVYDSEESMEDVDEEDAE